MILDNLSTHKTKLVEAFLEEHPNVTLHFTPTYSSWLNQVELWFCGSRRFSGTCCRAASSRRPRIWRGSCGGTWTPTRSVRGPSAGSMPTPRGASLLGNFLQGQGMKGAEADPEGQVPGRRRDSLCDTSRPCGSVPYWHCPP